MNRFIQKIMLWVLKRTEHLDGSLNQAGGKENPRIRAMIEKRNMLKKAINQSGNSKGSAGKSALMSKTIADSLAAKKAAMTPPKKSRAAKAKKTGRGG